MKKRLGLLCLGLCLGLSGMAAGDQNLQVYADKNSGFSATVDIRVTHTVSQAECVVKYNEIVQRLEVTNRIILNTYPCAAVKNLDGKIIQYTGHIYVATI